MHIGFDLAGGMRFGPDVEFVEKIDYTFDLSKEAEENLIRKSMINEAISQLHNRMARIL